MDGSFGGGVTNTSPRGGDINTQVKQISIKAPNMSLKSLGPQATPSYGLSDLTPDIQASPAINNQPSNVNNAAYTAMLGDQNNLVSNYQSALAESQQSGGYSPTTDVVVGQAKQQAMKIASGALMNFMANPDVPDEQKSNAASMVYDPNSAAYSPTQMLAMKGLDADSSSDSSKEAANQRLDVGGWVNQYNTEMQARQQIYNSVKVQTDPNALSKAYDFITGIVPGVSNIRNAKALSSAGIGSFGSNLVKTFLEKGGLEKSTSEYLDSLPADQSLNAAQNMADVLSAHPGNVITTPDEVTRRDVLDNALSGQGVSTTQQILGNIGGWADAVMLGGVLKNAVKGAIVEGGENLGKTSVEDVARQTAAQDTSSVVNPAATSVDPAPSNYTKINQNTLGNFLKSRETQFYNSGNGIPYTKNPQTALSSAIQDAIRSDVQPNSVFMNVKNTNPDMTKALYDDMTQDTTGTVAQAVTGAARTDALAGPVIPEIANEDGSVTSKVSTPDTMQRIRDQIPPQVMDFINHDGLSQFDQNEKALTNAWKVNQFQNAIGMTPRNEMFQLLPDMTNYVENPQGFSFRGVYGPQDAGFSNAQDALDTARFALRNTGASDESLGLLQRQADKYVPVDKSEWDRLPQNGDYLVSVDHDYRISPGDVSRANEVGEAGGMEAGSLGKEMPDGRVWSPWTFKRTQLARKLISSGQSGMLSNHLLDFGSQLPSNLYTAALASAERGAGIEKSLDKVVGEFSKSWKGLDTPTKQVLHDEILSANAASRPYDFQGLIANGASQEDTKVLKKFGQIQDTLWYLRNKYLTKQLDNAGYEEYVHTNSMTNMPVRRLGQGTLKGDVKYWNPDTGNVEVKSASDVADMYKNGGGVARLRQPFTTANGDTAEYVLHTTNPNDGYLRAFNQNSQVLNYRPGHYDVRYNKPMYVIQEVNGGAKNAAKGGFDQAVSTASTTSEAKLIADRLTAQTGDTHYYRPSNEMLASEISHHEMDLSVAQGQSSFRARGKMLQDGNTPVNNLSLNHIQNPIESVMHSIAPLSKKIALQDVADTIKQKAVNFYSDLLPADNNGRPLIPTDLRDVRYRNVGNYDPKRIGDARTAFAYSNMLEHSYANLLDKGTKFALNSVADSFGQAALKTTGIVQKGANAGEIAARYMSNKSLTRGAKSLTFNATLGLSPFKQIILQGSQAAQLAALNPKWMVSSKAFWQPTYIALRSMGLDASNALVRQAEKSAWGADSDAVYKQFQRSGIAAGIDHQSFVSGAVNDMTRNMIANASDNAISKIMRPARAVNTWSRKLGFDAGEFYSRTTSWAAHRDMYEQKGMNVFDDAVADRVTGESINYTGAMNSAGQLPSNKNALSIALQFTQNSQKQLLNAFTNRSIDSAVRNRLKVLNLALYGLPLGGVMSYMSQVQDPDQRMILSQGLEGWAINKALSLSTGDKTAIDWSSLNPTGVSGAADLIHTLWTDGFGAMMARTPAGSLLWGGNPRLSSAISSLAKYVHISDNYGTPETFADVATNFAKISSGFTNLFKAKYLYEFNKKINSSGSVSDADAKGWGDTIGTAMGFPTINEGINYYLQNQNSQDQKDDQANVKALYTQMKQHYESDLLGGNQLEYTQNVLNEAHRAFGDDQYAQAELSRLINQDFANGQTQMMQMALKNCSMYNNGHCQEIIDNTNFTDPNTKATLKALVQNGDDFKPDEK